MSLSEEEREYFFERFHLQPKPKEEKKKEMLRRISEEMASRPRSDKEVMEPWETNDW